MSEPSEPTPPTDAPKPETSGKPSSETPDLMDELDQFITSTEGTNNGETDVKGTEAEKVAPATPKPPKRKLPAEFAFFEDENLTDKVYEDRVKAATFAMKLGQDFAEQVKKHGLGDPTKAATTAIRAIEAMRKQMNSKKFGDAMAPAVTAHSRDEKPPSKQLTQEEKLRQLLIPVEFQ